MKNKDICSAYDSILPSTEEKERVLQKILTAAAEPRREKETTGTRKRPRRYVGILAAAAVLVVVLSCTVMACSGALGSTFGLWLGGQKVELDEFTPVAFQLETYLEEYPDGFANFGSYDDFTEATGMSLTDSEQISFSDVWVDIDVGYHGGSQYYIGHLGLEIEVDGAHAYTNGMFLAGGEAPSESLSYGVESSKAYYVYEYAPGRKAYFVKDKDPDSKIQVYFTENGIIYQLMVDKSKEGKELGKKIVDCIAGLKQ
jgi:hypothetical protein